MFLPSSYCSDKSSRSSKISGSCLLRRHCQIKQLNIFAVWPEIPIFDSIVTKLHRRYMAQLWEYMVRLPESPLVRDLTRGTRPSKGMRDTCDFDGMPVWGSIYAELKSGFLEDLCWCYCLVISVLIESLKIISGCSFGQSSMSSNIL